MTTTWKSGDKKPNNQSTNNTISGTTLSSWSQQQKLAMIAAFAMLGRSAEAEAEAARFIERIALNWYGPQPATRQAIMKWHLHIHPIGRREEWTHLRDGLTLAGLPTDSIEHGVW